MSRTTDQPLSVAIHIDGGSRGNPGPAAAGIVLREKRSGQVLREVGLFLGEATNNVAEYRALVAALKEAAALRAVEVELWTDSELLVRQMNGEYRVRNAGLKPLFEEAQRLAGRFTTCTIRHVPRGQNTRADRLVNRAMNLRRDVDEAAG
jgi:ribonuclease HI